MNMYKCGGGANKPNAYYVCPFYGFSDSWYDADDLIGINTIIVVGETTGQIAGFMSNSSNKSQLYIQSWDGNVATIQMWHGSGSGAWSKSTTQVTFDFSQEIGTNLVNWTTSKLRVLGYVNYIKGE